MQCHDTQHVWHGCPIDILCTCGCAATSCVSPSNTHAPAGAHSFPIPCFSLPPHHIPHRSCRSWLTPAAATSAQLPAAPCSAPPLCSPHTLLTSRPSPGVTPPALSRRALSTTSGRWPGTSGACPGAATHRQGRLPASGLVPAPAFGEMVVIVQMWPWRVTLDRFGQPVGGGQGLQGRVQGQRRTARGVYQLVALSPSLCPGQRAP